MNLFAPEWILRSLAIGALAAACVFFCPTAWRGRLRRSVPAAAFVMLLLLPLWKFAPVKFEAPAAVAELAVAASFDGWQWLALVWLVGAAVFLSRLFSGFFAIRSLLSETCAVPGEDWAACLAATQKTLGIRGRVHLRLAGPGFIPSATGLFRRTILIPDEALRWTQEQRRLVLLHELGHFRRGDLWIHALGRIACAFHWFNPFVWALQHQLSLEREYAVDELVIEQGVSPAEYATILWEMAKAATRRPASAAAYLAMAQKQPGKLEQRVSRILAPVRRTSRVAGALDAMLCLAALMLLIFCSACRPSANAASTRYPIDEVRQRLDANPFPGEAP